MWLQVPPHYEWLRLDDSAYIQSYTEDDDESQIQMPITGPGDKPVYLCIKPEESAGWCDLFIQIGESYGSFYSLSYWPDVLDYIDSIYPVE